MRYVLDPNDTWHTARTDLGFSPIPIIVQCRDLRDLRTGHVFLEGAWRVCAPGHRTRVFKGETAHSDAQRWARDIMFTERRKDLS